jgi:hypothetical protein
MGRRHKCREGQGWPRAADGQGRARAAKARDGQERPRLDLFCTADERMKSTDRRSTFAMHVGDHKALLHMVLSDADGPAPAG